MTVPPIKNAAEHTARQQDGRTVYINGALARTSPNTALSAIPSRRRQVCMTFKPIRPTRRR